MPRLPTPDTRLPIPGPDGVGQDALDQVDIGIGADGGGQPGQVGQEGGEALAHGGLVGLAQGVEQPVDHGGQIAGAGLGQGG